MSNEWTLPSSWRWTTMGNIADVIGGGTPDTREASNFGGSIPWITPADLSTHRAKTIMGGSRTISESGMSNSGAKLLPIGTVLFSSRAPIGYVAVAARQVSTNQGFKSFAPVNGISSDYLYYWLSSSKRRAENLASGTTFLELSGAKAALLPVPLAPSSEQCRISAKLEELLSDLDAGVAELKAAQRKLVQYRQSLLKAAVEGALTAEWRAQHPPKETGAQLLARILEERRARWEARQLDKFKAQGKAPPKDWQKKYPEPVAPVTTDLPVLPEGWEWASCEQLCDFITKGTTPTKGLDDGSQADVPFLRVTNLTDRGVLDMRDQVFVSETTHKGLLARSVVYPFDVLMNIVGPPLGQVSVVPNSAPEWNINQAIAIFRAVDGILPSYLSTYLLSPVAQRWLRARAKTTAGQTNLTLELCRSLPLPLPSTLEQQAMEVLVAASTAATSDQEAAIATALVQTNAQRQNILRAAFAGELVPQDPADEPASALLARVRSERAAKVSAVGNGRKPRRNTA